MRAFLARTWVKVGLVLMALPPALAEAHTDGGVADDVAETVLGISRDPSHGIEEGFVAALQISAAV